MVHSDPNESPMLSLPSLVVTEYLLSMLMWMGGSSSDPRRGSEAALAAVEVTKKLGAGE